MQSAHGMCTHDRAAQPLGSSLIDGTSRASPTVLPRDARTGQRSGFSLGRVRHEARDWRRGLAFALGLSILSITAGAAELTSLSVSPANPTVAIGAIQSF